MNDEDRTKLGLKLRNIIINDHSVNNLVDNLVKVFYKAKNERNKVNGRPRSPKSLKTLVFWEIIKWITRL